jgi:hypothetical protein
LTFVDAAATGSSSTLSDVEPGLLGFLVVTGIAVVLVFLLRSMNRHLRKLGPKPEDMLAEDLLRAGLEAQDEQDAEQAPDGAVPGEVLSRKDAVRRD